MQLPPVYGSPRTSRGPPLSPSGHPSFHLSAVLPVSDGPPLLVLALPTAEPELELGPTADKVQTHRHQGEPALLGLADQPGDLMAVQEELPGPLRLVPTLACAVLVRRNVKVLHPQLAARHSTVRVGERGTAGAEGLHLGAGEHHTRLERFLDVVVVPGSSVGSDGVFCSGHGSPR